MRSIPYDFQRLTISWIKQLLESKTETKHRSTVVRLVMHVLTCSVLSEDCMIVT
jgi:hypothetical protein